MRTVLAVVFDGVLSLDLTGPVEVFAGANTWWAERGPDNAYEIRTASIGGTPVGTSSGLVITPDSALGDGPAADLLLVPGGEGAREQPDVVDWLRGNARRAERLVSVCSGAFLRVDATTTWTTSVCTAPST